MDHPQTANTVTYHTHRFRITHTGSASRTQVSHHARRSRITHAGSALRTRVLQPQVSQHSEIGRTYTVPVCQNTTAHHTFAIWDQNPTTRVRGVTELRLEKFAPLVCFVQLSAEFSPPVFTGCDEHSSVLLSITWKH